MKWCQPLVTRMSSKDVTWYNKRLNVTVEKGRHRAIHWDDVVQASTLFEDTESIGLSVIERLLGYLPPQSVTLPYETFLRALVHSYRHNQLSGDDFTQQVTDHVKLIRNADMQANNCPTYTPNNYAYYHETLLPYGIQVRERLTWLLGYEPQIEHSLIAELWLRTQLAKDTNIFSDQITAIDLRAISLIKYREVLSNKGKSAAENSMLWGHLSSKI